MKVKRILRLEKILNKVKNVFRTLKKNLPNFYKYLLN